MHQYLTRALKVKTICISPSFIHFS